MKIFFLGIISLVASIYAFAHEGHGGAPAKAASATLHTVMAVSDKYEYVLKFPHVSAGEWVAFSLYINAFATNAPVQALQTLRLRLGKDVVHAKAGDSGVYTFSAKVVSGAVHLQVELAGALGPDLVLLKGIDPTQELEETRAEADSTALPAWVWILAAALGGAALSYGAVKLTTRRRAALFLFMLWMPAGHNAPALFAHEGHGNPAPKAAGFSTDGSFAIAKESQFLFGMLTERVGATAFAPSDNVFGTVVAAPQGQSSVIAPQAGSVTQLFVHVGAHVRAGQTLAILEQVVDAQTLAQLQADRNTATSDLAAAKADYDRLQKVADIAAARDLSEARSRYQRALQNSRLYRQAAVGSGRRIAIKSPISGVLQNFAVAQGATLAAGASLFTVTNLSSIYVEAQVFDNLLPAFYPGRQLYGYVF